MWSVSLEYLLINQSVFGDLYVNIKCQRWVVITLQNVNKQVFFESWWEERKYGVWPPACAFACLVDGDYYSFVGALRAVAQWVSLGK